MPSSLFGNNPRTQTTGTNPTVPVKQTVDPITMVEEELKQSNGDAKAAYYSLAKKKGVDPEAFLKQIAAIQNPMEMLTGMMAKNSRIGSLFRMFSFKMRIKTMDVWYFKEKIPDELHGAKDYIKRAIEIRAMHSPWAKQLVDMSSTELEHATMLYKMFQEYYAKISSEFKELPDYIKEANEMLNDEYTKCSAEVKTLHEIYRM